MCEIERGVRKGDEAKFVKITENVTQILTRYC